MESLCPILERMPVITLEQMKEVQLLNRVDQKYLLNRSQLTDLLHVVENKYFVQRIAGDALAPYKTLYFDTVDLAMYTAHHNKKLHRQKLRVRCYRSTQTTFFEIKNKDNKGKTRKKRIPIDASLFEDCLNVQEVKDFLKTNSPYALSSLLPQVENSFRRITLVDKAKTERVTIDSEIRFVHRQKGTSFDLSPLVVMEVKHEVGAPASAVEQALRCLRVQPNRMSKYCIGTVLTNADAKRNRFKPKIRNIHEIIATSL